MTSYLSDLWGDICTAWSADWQVAVDLWFLYVIIIAFMIAGIITEVRK